MPRIQTWLVFPMALLLPPVVSAQNAPRVIEEIVVTAQKTEQTLKEVPVAVSAMSADQLQEAGVFGAEGIENYVPNLEMDTDPQAPSIGIRGFSTNSYNVGLEPSVGIAVDEVAIGRSEFIPDGLFDMQAVEVLRGPQGTLFGKNTIAGVIVMRTADPGDVAGGDLLMTVGEKGERRLEGGVSLPLGSKLGVRLALTGWRSDGDVDNSFLSRGELDIGQKAGRLKLHAYPTDRMTLKFGAQVSDTKSNFPGWQLYELDPDALDYAQSKHAASEDDPFDEHTAFDLPGYVKRDSQILHAIADTEFDRFNFTAIVGHAGLTNDALVDFDVSAADLANVDFIFDYTQDSLELRFSGGADSLFGWGQDLEYVGGLFGFQSELSINVNVVLGKDIFDFGASPAGMEALGAPAVGALGDLLAASGGVAADPMDSVNQFFEQSSESFAGFGQMTWFMTPRVALILGLRYGRELKSGRLTVQSSGPGITAQLLEAEDFSTALARTESDVSPKLGLKVDWNDAWSTYLTLTRGFKGGGFNGISFQNSDLSFEPERGDSLEVGARGRLFGGALALNTTAYLTEVDNMQVVNFNGVAFDVFNAAQARLTGFEADLTWLPRWEWLSVNAAVGLSSAEYLEYTNAPTPAGSADSEQDLSGETLPKAPVMSVSLSPTVSLPLGDRLGIQFGLTVSHRGEQYLELDLDPVTFQKAYTLLNARIIVGPPDGRWSVLLIGDNLTDTESLNFVADHNLFANSFFANQGPLRRVSLSLKASF